MAEAIASGLDEEFEVVGRDEEKLKKFAEKFKCKYSLLDNYNMDGKIVILAIKPYALQYIGMQLKGVAKILISILAGKKLFELEKYIKAKSYIRAMPNIAAKYKRSITVITGDKEAKEEAIKILSKIGEVVWVENDNELDIATAIVGSAPAYLAIIAEAIVDSGVYLGLKREVSEKLTRGLFNSFAALKEEYPHIKNSIMSPKGTTAEGIRSLEKNGIRGDIFEAIIATYEKTKSI